jgi:hypothetical protein
MSETVNTQEMAQILSEPIFTTFGWIRVGPTDTNWECVELEKHGKKKAKTHPSDAVFRYYDPYRGVDVYLNTDLKSYKADTLEKTELAATLRNLARATECATKSEKWAELFANEEKNWQVAGLLFIYNHDGNYDRDFTEVLTEVQPSEVPVAEGQCVYVLGPKDICYLNTVALDINANRGQKLLPDAEFCGFYYPDLEDAIAAKSRKHSAATIEQMLSPWQILRYDKHDSQSLKSGYYFYYRGEGKSVDEFKYLIDYIFKYQLLGDLDQISIRMPFASTGAAAIFERSKIQYQDDFWSVGNASPEAFGERLKRITCNPISSVKEKFSVTAIGMKKRK